MSFDIRQAGAEDIPALEDIYRQMGKAPDGSFAESLEKDCVILITSQNQQDIGFGLLNFEPKYSLYKKLDIPEIQDVNVVPEARNQGAAGALLAAFEDLARDQGAEQIGISVGLTKDYGAAQRLYVKAGYVPDGYGVTACREPVEAGRRYALDDDLCLMMVKTL